MEIAEYKKMDELEEYNWWYLGRRNIIQKLFGKYMYRIAVDTYRNAESKEQNIQNRSKKWGE